MNKIYSSHSNNDNSYNNDDDNDDDNSNNYDDDDNDDNSYDNDTKLIILIQLLTLFLLSITAPLSTNSVATFKLPPYAAQCSGVHPSYERYA